MNKENIQAIIGRAFKNYLYIFWFMINFWICWKVLGGEFDSFITLVLIYIVTISVSISPVGEMLLRLFESARPVLTKQEKEYLMPIYTDVYEDIKAKNSKINDVVLYIQDVMTVNAFAIGKHTVVITKGAIETFSESELKGVLVHEFGHIVHGHTMSAVLNVVGNGIFSIAVLTTRLYILLIELIIITFEKSIILKILFTLIRFIFDMILVLLLFIGQAILSLNSQQQEFEADKFVYENGYGSELVGALYLLQKMNMSQKMTIKQKLTASHPLLAFRINKIENMLDGQENVIMNPPEIIKEKIKEVINVNENNNRNPKKYSDWKDILSKLEETTENKYKFKYLDLVEYNNGEYIIISKNKGKRETKEDVIIIKRAKLKTTGKKYYVLIEDEEIIETVFAIYRIEKVDKILL